MRLLLELFFFLVPLGLGCVLGWAARGRQPANLPKTQRNELMLYRQLGRKLTTEASQHIVLGDNFANIVADELSHTYDAIDKLGNN